MEITYPFTPGTRAVAQQVNTNFADVKSAVDPLEVAVADIETQLTSGIVLPDGSVDFTRLQSYKTYTVSNATNATPIVITAVAHGFLTGDKVYINGVGGNTAANGTFTITKLGADTFELDDSVGNGTFSSNGTVVIYPVINNNLVNKVYVDNGDLKSITQIGTCATASNDVTLTGTITATNSSTAVTGSGTSFITECPTGSTIVINGTPCFVTNVASNTSLTISQGYPNKTFTGTAYKANNTKVVTLSNFTLEDGITIRVFNTNKNFGYTPSFNVNSTGNILLCDESRTDVGVLHPCFIPANCEIEVTYSSALNRWIYKNREVLTYIVGNGSGVSKLYSNGYHIEKGNIASATDGGVCNITFVYPFVYDNYYATRAALYGNTSTDGGTYNGYTNGIGTRSLTGMAFRAGNSGPLTCVWKAEGF